jgi:hypothetical protein
VRSNTFVDRPWQLREFKTEESIAIIFMINHSVLTTMLAIAGTEVKTVKDCSW